MGRLAQDKGTVRIHVGLSTVWRWVVLVGVLFGLGAQPVAAQGTLTGEELEAFFDAEIMQQLAEEQLIGATVSVVQGDALLFAKGYGYADLAAQRPVDADRTLFYIGSDGKLFTWTAIMQLVEQGRVDLHADVNTYLNFEIPDVVLGPEGVRDAVTLHHLMTHTAGFEEQSEALPCVTMKMRQLCSRIWGSIQSRGD